MQLFINFAVPFFSAVAAAGSKKGENPAGCKLVCGTVSRFHQSLTTLLLSGQQRVSGRCCNTSPLFKKNIAQKIASMSRDLDVQKFFDTVICSLDRVLHNRHVGCSTICFLTRFHTTAEVGLGKPGSLFILNQIRTLQKFQMLPRHRDHNLSLPKILASLGE